MADEALPPCGLYRTTLAHPDRAQQVPASRLIYFHNHSSHDIPVVLMPQENTNNKWKFSDGGYLVRTLSWCRSLIPLRPEGIYTVGAGFPAGRGRIGTDQLVQLGYNRDGDPILFFPRYDPATNGLVFPTEGFKIDTNILAALRPVELRGPIPPDDER